MVFTNSGGNYTIESLKMMEDWFKHNLYIFKRNKGKLNE